MSNLDGFDVPTTVCDNCGDPRVDESGSCSMCGYEDFGGDDAL